MSETVAALVVLGMLITLCVAVLVHGLQRLKPEADLFAET